MDVTNRDNAQHYTWGDGGDAWYRLQSADLSVVEERVPPGGTEAPHYHRKSRQVFYVLEGRVEFKAGKKSRSLSRGDSVDVAAGTVHSLSNPTDEPAFLLVISSPESHSDRIDVEPAT